MIEIFITNINTQTQAKTTLNQIKNNFPDLKEDKKTFACGHTILRIEGDFIYSKKIISELKGLVFKCEILQDKICV